MDGGTVTVVVAIVAAVPLTISAIASLVTARNTGSHGELSRRFKELNRSVRKLDQRLVQHVTDSEIHRHG